MKVLFLVRDLGVGGSQRQLGVLAAGLARRGHDAAVAVLYAGGALEASLAGSGARLISIEKTSRWNVVAPLARLRRLFVSERPDLVYAFLPTQTTLAALLLPARLGTKLVFGLRAGGMQLDRYDALSALSYRTEAWLARRADLIVANARAVRADAAKRGLPAARVSQSSRTASIPTPCAPMRRRAARCAAPGAFPTMPSSSAAWRGSIR